MEQVFNECVAEHTAAGTTVLLSSHILSEVERLADRVTIIRERPDGRDRHARRAAPPAAQPGPGRGRRRRSRTSPGSPACTTSTVDGRGRLLHRSTPTALPPLLERRSPRPASLSLTSTPPTLEELFLDAYREPRRERAGDATGDRAARRGSRCAVTGSLVPVVGGAARRDRATPARRPPARSTPRRPTGSAAAEAINASPAIVALYGPILDVAQPRRAGDDQDDRALRRVRRASCRGPRTPPHPRRGGDRTRRAARRRPRSARDAPLAAALVGGACSPSVVLGVLAAARQHRGRAARRRLGRSSGRPGPGSAWSARRSPSLAAQLSEQRAHGRLRGLRRRSASSTSCARSATRRRRVAELADAVRLGHAAQRLVRAARLGAGCSTRCSQPRLTAAGVASAAAPRPRRRAARRTAPGPADGLAAAARRPGPRLAPAGDRAARLDGRHRRDGRR